jgi:peptidyl-prolyl cis-trans isomerase A (cyclophilin A)
MTKTKTKTLATTTCTLLASLALAAAGAGCKKEAPAAGGTAPASSDKAGADKAAMADKAATPGKPATPGADPENGDFTLEEATAGLPGQGTLMAKIGTAKGDLHCELFFDAAPKTVASFVGLTRGLRAWQDPKTGEWVKKPFFDGLAFHRVIPAYNNPDIGAGGPGYELPNENKADLKFDRPGRLAMANAGRDTGGSQFFVTEIPKKSLDGNYTIFGQCDGEDVVKQIARVAVDSPDHNKPVEPLTMKVEIYRK